MSDTDIYKKREAMPQGGSKMPKKQKKRRSSSQRAFDADPNRKRRSKNSGLRRLLHLSRKRDNEKFFWGSLGIGIVVLLIIIGLWQFVVVEQLIRTEEQKDDYIEYQPNIPEVSESAAK